MKKRFRRKLQTLDKIIRENEKTNEVFSIFLFIRDLCKVSHVKLTIILKTLIFRLFSDTQINIPVNTLEITLY